MEKKIDHLRGAAKAFVALFVAPLSYVAGQLATDGTVDARLVASFAITALLVWAVPNYER